MTEQDGSTSAPSSPAPTPVLAATVPEVGPRPAPGAPVVLAETSAVPPDGLYVVSYADEDYVFGEGAWGRFGRDDSRCEIPVWEEVRGASLSRLAGELWCFQGDLWVRNLSTSHELTVVGSAGRPTTLPPRDSGERGPACSVPAASATISAPSTGDWVLSTRRLPRATRGDARPAPAEVGTDDEPSTARMALLPASLLAVATELCAPMLERGAPPATYDEIAARLDISKRQARRYVDKLCEFYGDSLPEDRDDSPHGRPHYVPVAELLVGRGRITREDVERQRLLRAPSTPRA